MLVEPEPPETTPAPAAERLWRDVHERLTAFVAQRIDDPADVADLVQTVFLRVHQHVATVSDEERLLPWLFQVTRNAIADYYRAPARRREVAEVPADSPHAPSDESLHDDEDRALAELAGCVRPMLQQLPPSYRDALTRVEFEGQAQNAAASDLGISVSGMKSRVQRGRAMLRDALLKCCEVSLSATGGVMDYEERGRSGCASPCRNDALS